MSEISSVRRLFVEKRPEFAVEAKELMRDLIHDLGISSIKHLRVLNRYDISGITDSEYKRAADLVFSEPQLDVVFHEKIDTSGADFVLGVESLPGQFNQRADSAAQCVQILTCGNRPDCHTAKIILIYGNIDENHSKAITEYLVNPVESRVASMEKPETLQQITEYPEDIEILNGFREMDNSLLDRYVYDKGLAMTAGDLVCIKDYFISEGRDPSITELRVLDTYWSDHCRHTTFNSIINSVNIERNDVMSDAITNTYELYLNARDALYGERVAQKPVSLMDLATMAMKVLKSQGKLDDLDVSDEINACSIKVPVITDAGVEDYLVMFKNETHNHPTEIEPFGGAATCLGGAIRDPLSGRSYVYQAMRVTGSGDPTRPISETLPGKLSQKRITTGAAAGYSSYGNQIGLATGLVDEIYHPGYIAKRMEIGAVIAAVPAANVRREKPVAGDIVILLGGRTGRDGCGGATGSSKEHNEDSLQLCGAEVQKGNPPTERKIQRFFRNPSVSSMIKKCNDFGAGGVCVAIGELADGIEINLDAVPKKYEGLDGTELAISESQERMAVVISESDETMFLEEAAKENLEAVRVAIITENPRMKMLWRNKVIVDISRDFIDTNGANSTASIFIKTPEINESCLLAMPACFNSNDIISTLKCELSRLSNCSRKGLAERFDATIGAGTVLMPFGGKNQTSPENGMAAKIPVASANTDTSSIMTYGFNPYISSWSPYHGAYYAVLESLAKLAAIGGNPDNARLTFQEYFEKLGKDSYKWGKPFAALLGAYQAQIDFGTPAIGGKDSMSGTFMDINVPPTLVSFAVGIAQADEVVSASLKESGNIIIYFPVRTDVNLIPRSEVSKRQFTAMRHLNNRGLLKSAAAVQNGVAVTLAKMSFGNNIGIEIALAVNSEDLFRPATGSLIAEVSLNANEIIHDTVLEELFAHGEAYMLGTTNDSAMLSFGNSTVPIADLLSIWESKLEDVFPTNALPAINYENLPIRKSKPKITASLNIARPRVIIPVFPGTNCEYDTARAFEIAGAIPEIIIFKNTAEHDVAESINALKKAIKSSNILMIPGGFSGGDEPDGSGKFISTAFRNPYIAEEIEDLLYKRDGLVLGICNGFQALIKLGLLPFGHICETDSQSATLTYNNIGRHVSSYVRTKITSNSSPWLRGCVENEIHLIPVSHGEGRFTAPEHILRDLFANDQIATQYVDMDGRISDKIPYNPNGSACAIEGITSPDGRIFGKMGHSERIGSFVGKNIPGNKDQKIFESGVKYFM